MKRRLTYLFLGVAVATSFAGCSQSNEAKPAENLVTERPKGFVKGKDGKMTSDSIKSSANP